MSLHFILVPCCLVAVAIIQKHCAVAMELTIFKLADVVLPLLVIIRRKHELPFSVELVVLKEPIELFTIGSNQNSTTLTSFGAFEPFTGVSGIVVGWCICF